MKPHPYCVVQFLLNTDSEDYEDDVIIGWATRTQINTHAMDLRAKPT